MSLNLAENHPLTSSGHDLEMGEDAFGELRDSSYLAGDPTSLRLRMEEDGYLFMRGFFQRDDVLAARRVIVLRMAAEGLLDADSIPMEAVIAKGKESAFRPDLTRLNTPLDSLLYGMQTMNFYADFFGEPARHYDFTWLRAISPGKGTRPHCDMVYMGRGAREKLLTAWVPLGETPLNLGGLIILEGSHQKQEILQNYLKRDVDTYCANGRHAADIEAGRKLWEWDGSLSKDPVSLRRKLGGRWLTTHFEPGDLLTFTMCTVHASLDNHTENRIRFSSDSRYQPASLPIDERWVGENPIAHGPSGKRSRIC